MLVYNLGAPNWIYGASVTEQDVTKAYLKLSETGSLSVCHLEKPFIKSGTSDCFNCVSPNNIFDLSTQTCTNCPSNSTLNDKTHTCEAKQKNITSINTISNTTSSSNSSANNTVNNTAEIGRAHV